MGGQGRYARKDLDDKKCVGFIQVSTENQLIFLPSCKDLGVGGWGLKNPYVVRILNPLEIIGRSLKLDCHKTNHTQKSLTYLVEWCRLESIEDKMLRWENLMCFELLR